jgi:epoxyqueuosine reductase
LLAWDEAEFLRRTEGSPIRRIGHERWQRNIAVALGNALRTDLAAAERLEIENALQQLAAQATPLVQEHAAWALAQTQTGQNAAPVIPPQSWHIGRS